MDLLKQLETENRVLQEEVKSLEGKLEEFGRSTEEDRRIRTEESNELRRLLKKLDSQTSARLVMLEEASRTRTGAVEDQIAVVTLRLEDIETQTIQLKDEMEKQVIQLNETSRIQSEVAVEESAAISRRVGDVDRRCSRTVLNLTRVESAVRALEAWRSDQMNLTSELSAQVSQLTSPLVESIANHSDSLKEVSSPQVSNEWSWRESQTAFEPKQATGLWFSLEEFGESPYVESDTCDEWDFSLTGTTIGATTRNKMHGERGELKFNFTVDTLSPHYWTDTHGGWVNTWLRTDYFHWGILLGCENKDISSCNNLRILSRTRTLPDGALEGFSMFAGEVGFSKTDGHKYRQDYC